MQWVGFAGPTQYSVSKKSPPGIKYFNTPLVSMSHPNSTPSGLSLNFNRIAPRSVLSAFANSSGIRSATVTV
jgi:hypothetical protein